MLAADHSKASAWDEDNLPAELGGAGHGGHNFAAAAGFAAAPRLKRMEGTDHLKGRSSCSMAAGFLAGFANQRFQHTQQTVGRRPVDFLVEVYCLSA